MKKISREVSNALDSECAHSMEQLLENKISQNFSDLTEVLNSDSVSNNDKAKALYALGRWGDKAAVAAIVKALPKLDEIARVSAVDALGRLDSTESITAIEKLSTDNSPYVRKFTAQTLLRSKKAQAAKILKSMEARETVDFVRRYISQ